MINLAKCPACEKLAAAVPEWSADTMVRCPHCQKEFSLRDAGVQPLAELTQVTRSHDPAITPPEPAVSGTDEFPAMKSGRSSSEPLTVMPTIHAEDYESLTPEQKQQLDAAAAVAARLGGSQKKRSWFGELIKIILGGVVGLAVGYWLLNYFGGPRFDWLSVYLPGCPHTSDHWPVEYFRDKSAEPTNNQPIPVVPIEDLMGPGDEMKLEGLPEPDIDPSPAPPDDPPDASTMDKKATNDLPSLPGLDEMPTQDEPVGKDKNNE